MQCHRQVSKSPHPSPPVKPKLPPEPIRPIIREICNNSLGAFSGFGRHTANDFLFLQAIFPGMPSRLLCEDETTFNEFVSAIQRYLSSFTTAVFLKTITTVANSKNPFVFNETSNEKYMKHHLLIFRRKYAKVVPELLDRYCKAGLLDPEHVMGIFIPSFLRPFYLLSRRTVS